MPKLFRNPLSDMWYVEDNATAYAVEPNHNLIANQDEGKEVEYSLILREYPTPRAKILKIKTVSEMIVEGLEEFADEIEGTRL